MPNLIDSAQLQATAQVAKSYVLEQDTANVNTIINALQTGGSTPAPAGKQEGIITLTTNDGGYTYNVDYNGDGQLFVVNDSTCDHATGTLSGNTLTVKQLSPTYTASNGYVVALATDNFTAAIASFQETYR